MQNDLNAVFDLLIREIQDKKSAIIDFQNKTKPVVGHKVVVDLGKTILENDPMLVNFSFRSVFVESASDTTCEVYLKPITKEDLQPAIRFTLKDSWSVDHQISKAYLHWPIQTGKKITLVFFPNSEFKSGSQLSVNSGGVSLSDGASFTITNPTFAAATVVQILATNINRKVSTVTNKSSGSLWIGDGAVSPTGVNRGREIFAGETFEWRNSSLLYGYFAVAGDLNIMEEV